MRKYLSSIVVILIVLSGCAQDEKKENEKLSVVTSFYPMYDFATKIGGDKIDVVNLIPGGVEPHDWEPETNDIMTLEKADVLIYNGAEMEHWVDKTVESLSNDKLNVINASKGIKLLGEEGKETDPHVWLSVRYAKKQMETIKDALVEIDKENKDYYEANYETYAKEFDALDKEYQDTIDTLTSKDLVVSHQAFAYLCKDYGLNQIAVEGLAPESEPDAKRMVEIIQLVKDKQVKTIFFEEKASAKVAETIASETGANTGVLSTVESLSEKDQKDGKNYLSIMRENLAAIQEALK